jgi:peroxin-19
MQEMMKQMESLADNGDFQNMLEGMMSQLMSKDLLYEPMKDLAAKVSGWRLFTLTVYTCVTNHANFAVP